MMFYYYYFGISALGYTFFKVCSITMGVSDIVNKINKWKISLDTDIMIWLHKQEL